jgi:hypothetical protein
MKFGLFICFILSINSFRSQLPSYAKSWYHLGPDTTINYSGKDTAYSITEWWLANGSKLTPKSQKNAIQHWTYFVNSDSLHFQQRMSEYKDGTKISNTTFKSSGIRKELYDKDGTLTAVYISADNGVSFYLLMKNEYHSKKKRTVTFYYPNGNIQSQGKEVKAEIIAGCDSGMHVFVKHGKWKYYNEDGSLKNEKEEVVKSQVYEIKK